MNEETIAGVVGWGRTVGAVASMISVDLYEPGRIRRTMAKGGDKYTIFRIGEPHGRITPRVEALVKWFSGIDSAKATTNLWGERWSKLVQNAMGNGVTAASGLTSPRSPKSQVSSLVPSMAQDILKGRRTEIDAMNGFIARKGAEVGIAAPSHVKLAGIVTRIERGELKPSPSLLA